MNPYAAKRQTIVKDTREPVVASLRNSRVNRRTGTVQASASEMMFDPRTGQINASSDKDLLQAIAGLIKMANDGTIKRGIAQADIAPEEGHKLLMEAYHDTSGQKWRALGEVIGDEVYLTMNREGFARKLLLFKAVGPGEIGRLRIRQKDVTAWFLAADGKSPRSQIRQPWLWPPEFYINSFITIEDREIAQNTGDLLEEKHQDGLEAVMTEEDRRWKALADVAAAANIVYFNTFTPSVFSELRTRVAQWNLPVTSAVIAYDLWDDIIADADFSGWFDPVTKHELILEGQLGSLLGVQIITDAFREPNLKVLDSGECYFCAAPQSLGGILERQAVKTEPINRYPEGIPERGWFIELIEGMAIANTHGVSKGQRV